MKSLYLLVNLFTVLVPLVFSFHPKIRFYNTWKAFFAGSALVTLLFAVCDAFFTKWGVWSFNPRYITGLYVYNLPIEEILFFICIPFSCVFTFFCIDKFYNPTWKQRTESIVCIAFSLGLLVTGLIFTDRLYTSFTCITTACVCLLLKFVVKIDWFGKIVVVYAILLLPFCIVNGILTGTGLDEPVVIYNDHENLGVRLLTIPIEDVIYGFELILLNVFFYKLFVGLFFKPGNNT